MSKLAVYCKWKSNTAFKLNIRKHFLYMQSLIEECSVGINSYHFKFTYMFVFLKYGQRSIYGYQLFHLYHGNKLRQKGEKSSKPFRENINIFNN